jgi:uncharacterized membrane protein YdbT with pleckstrin-like domain
MDLHPGEEIIFEGRPSWRSTLGFYLGGLVLAAGAGAIVGLAKDSTWGTLVAIVVFALVLAVGFLRRHGTRYLLTDERLEIRRGLLARHVQETRLDRVQNVNTNQTIAERVLRIGTVDFDTAGSGDSDFAFGGVAHPERVVADVDRAQRAAAAAGPGGDAEPRTST